MAEEEVSAIKQKKKVKASEFGELNDDATMSVTKLDKVRCCICNGYIKPIPIVTGKLIN